ncbi:MAG TPA: DUF1684 domain-containing protein [Actinomycetota bacterium]
MSGTAGDLLDLLDWKRRVFELYAEVRSAAVTDPRAAWTGWRDVRDELFRTHPQSPIPEGERAQYAGVPMFDYDPASRTSGEVVPAEHVTLEIGASDGGAYRFTRFATVRFDLPDAEGLTLDAYWLEGYGGGLFLPFRDATAGRQTYGAGRYLMDTVKGSDLGVGGDGRLVLDFNFAYNPSCSYDPRWSCPLAPPANRLAVRIPAGERYEAGAAP